MGHGAWGMGHGAWGWHSHSLSHSHLHWTSCCSRRSGISPCPYNLPQYPAERPQRRWQVPPRQEAQVCAYSPPGPCTTRPWMPCYQPVYYSSDGFQRTRAGAPPSCLQKRVTVLLRFLPLCPHYLFLYGCIPLYSSTRINPICCFALKS